MFSTSLELTRRTCLHLLLKVKLVMTCAHVSLRAESRSVGGLRSIMAYATFSTSLELTRCTWHHFIAKS